MPSADCPPESPIAALIPAVLARLRPQPAPVGDLPPRQAAHADGDAVVFAVARLNPSGQISIRTVLTALGWTPGDRLSITVQRGCIVAAVAEHGGRMVGAGGLLVLPVAARRMCAIPNRSTVFVAALPDAGLLVVHPIATIARHLSRRHTQIVRSRHGRPA